jgi:glycosyltransferase involved in cell wall biosynthesis
LEALARIRDSSPNLRVVVAGSCADWHSYRVQIERLGIADKVVERIGWVNDDEVPLYFSACDVAALPYRHIDGSAVAATGAYLGVPLLLSDIPGFRATWADDEARFVQGGAESWAAVLNEVSAPPHLQDLRLRAGRARLRALHEMTWASSAAQHATVYQSAMDSFARRR